MSDDDEDGGVVRILEKIHSIDKLGQHGMFAKEDVDRRVVRED